MWQYRKVTFPSYSAPVSSCISLNTIYGIWLKFLFCLILLLFSFERFHSEILMWSCFPRRFYLFRWRRSFSQEEKWRSCRALECKSEGEGSRPGGVSFETFQLCRRSSTFVKGCQKSSIFLVKFSSGMSETFFDTCVNWSCVTRCRCRTTSQLFLQCVPVLTMS